MEVDMSAPFLNILQLCRTLTINPACGLIVTSKNHFFTHKFLSLNIAIYPSSHSDCKDEEGGLSKRQIRVMWLNQFLLQCPKSKKCSNCLPSPLPLAIIEAPLSPSHEGESFWSKRKHSLHRAEDHAPRNDRECRGVVGEVVEPLADSQRCHSSIV